MNNVNRTLYIPLCGKASVSRRGLFLRDESAERIWAEHGFPLRGKAASPWLALYMGVRAAVFDDWVRDQLAAQPDAVVLHVGCGLDSRSERIGAGTWFDVDMPEVIAERRLHFRESPTCRMIAGDLRDPSWLAELPDAPLIVAMEGVSMYLQPAELCAFLRALEARFPRVSLLMDCYSQRAARLSKYRNPINAVGVTQVYGVDDPQSVAGARFLFRKDHDMTPQRYIDQLRGAEKLIFRKLYAGKLSRSLYRLYEYRT